jgi:filamentous hemagglutinin family protein
MNGTPATHLRFKRISSAFLLSGLLLLSVSRAQITIDGSLGPAGALPGPNYVVPADKGQIRGANLFHSFGEFNVQTKESVTFKGPNTIVNIVARVTGGAQSYLDGRLRSDIKGANFYLLNPNGLMFGPNATLSMIGSFYVSTGDFLRFADGATFYAHLGQASALTVASPAAFGFLGKSAARIDIQGSTLRVGEEKTLFLAGGDLRIDNAALRAPSGRIQLVSVGLPRETMVIPTDAAPDVQTDNFSRLGRLQILPGSKVEASGSSDAGSSGAGGTVVIRSGRLMMDKASVRSDTRADADGAPLAIDVGVAEQAVLTNASELRVRPHSNTRARIPIAPSFAGALPARNT